MEKYWNFHLDHRGKSRLAVKLISGNEKELRDINESIMKQRERGYERTEARIDSMLGKIVQFTVQQRQKPSKSRKTYLLLFRTKVMQIIIHLLKKKVLLSFASFVLNSSIVKRCNEITDQIALKYRPVSKLKKIDF